MPPKGSGYLNALKAATDAASALHGSNSFGELEDRHPRVLLDQTSALVDLIKSIGGTAGFEKMWRLETWQ